MDQTLIKTLLESSLPLRLALLDADPTGWIVRSLSLNTAHTLTALDTDAQTLVRVAVKLGAAFLPCNPLAIVEHAARLASGASEESSRRYGLEYDTGDYTAWEGSLGEHGWKNVQDKCPHTAAVALLREVVG